MEQTAVVLASLFVDALQFIPDHAALLLHKAAETAELAFTALGIAILIAMPIGLWLGHRHRGLLLALGASSVGRALPSIALIGIFIAWLGVGFWNNTVALVILGIPPILTNTYFAVEGVDRDVVEQPGDGSQRATDPHGRRTAARPAASLAGVRIAAVFVIATADRGYRRRRRPR